MAELSEPSSTFSPSRSSRSSFSALSVIRKRKHGQEHTREELEWFIGEFTANRIPTYQVAAWLMAVYYQPLSPDEIAHLTRCMVRSGSTLQWDSASVRGGGAETANRRTLRVDKHSSGGVGDKTSLILAPLVAAVSEAWSLADSSGDTCAPLLQVPMMAGRGLGHTGGTIDKLESIPGYNATLSIESFKALVRTVGCAISAPTAEICPADRALYALRDATATVESVGLQTASIMSKKLAENPDFLVLDVKYGQGAFQTALDDAQQLAHSMVRTAHANGLSTVALLTRMDHPLGRAVGNWVEVVECLDLMTPSGKRSRLSRDLMIVTLVAALELLLQHGAADGSADADACFDAMTRALESGAVRDKFDEMVRAQGGDASVLGTGDRRFGPPTFQLKAPRSGVITNVHAQLVGLASVAMGAGRLKAEDEVDPGAGMVWHKQVGDFAEAGDVLVDVYSRADPDAWLDQLTASVEWGLDEAPPATPLPMVTHKVTVSGVQPYVAPQRLLDFANSWCNT